jgi:hypothetical protein
VGMGLVSWASPPQVYHNVKSAAIPSGKVCQPVKAMGDL